MERIHVRSAYTFNISAGKAVGIHTEFSILGNRDGPYDSYSTSSGRGFDGKCVFISMIVLQRYKRIII